MSDIFCTGSTTSSPQHPGAAITHLSSAFTHASATPLLLCQPRDLDETIVTSSSEIGGEDRLTLERKLHLGTECGTFKPASDQGTLEWQIPRTLCSRMGALGTLPSGHQRTLTSSRDRLCYTITSSKKACSHGSIKPTLPCKPPIQKSLPSSGGCPTL